MGPPVGSTEVELAEPAAAPTALAELLEPPPRLVFVPLAVASIVPDSTLAGGVLVALVESEEVPTP